MLAMSHLHYISRGEMTRGGESSPKIYVSKNETYSGKQQCFYSSKIRIFSKNESMVTN